VPRDKVKALARAKKYREQRKVLKYGPSAAEQDMRGRHGNHARGERSPRWSGDRLVTSQGYVAIRVAPDHPHAWGPPRLRNFKYAYEHVVVMTTAIGRPLASNEVVHHRNGDRRDNRLENLEILTRSEHMVEHETDRVRDRRGRYSAREFPR